MIKVLNKGFVQYINHMGDDLSVVNDARVSFKKTSKWVFGGGCDHTGDGLYLSERDTKLIKYLARNKHWTPFAHSYIKLRVKAPIFVARQLFKHKVGLNENEVSRRYVDDPPELYHPTEWRSRPEGGIKQGSGPKRQAFHYNPQGYLALYNRAIEEGIAPEQARMLLPQSMYTEWVWSGSLASFARVYNQRSHTTAQWEAQQYAAALQTLIEPMFPVSWKALTQAEGV